MPILRLQTPAKEAKYFIVYNKRIIALILENITPRFIVDRWKKGFLLQLFFVLFILFNLIQINFCLTAFWKKIRGSYSSFLQDTRVVSVTRSK